MAKFYLGCVAILVLVCAVLGYGYRNASGEAVSLKSDLEQLRAANNNLTRLVKEQGLIIERAGADYRKLEADNRRLEETNRRLEEFQRIDTGAIGAIRQLIDKGRAVTNSLTEKNISN